MRAFPVSAEELTTISFAYASFSPGSYTHHVVDDVGGTALVELYEMGPDAVIKPAS